jgi:hypothetical protein
MKNKNLVLRYFGLFLLIVGIILNILMFVREEYPTILFLLFCFIGILQIGISFYRKKIGGGWQFFWILFPFVVLYIYVS